jgi:hypothetical protein
MAQPPVQVLGGVGVAELAEQICASAVFSTSDGHRSAP